MTRICEEKERSRWGGHRENQSLYSPEVYTAVTAVVWHLCNRRPESELADYQIAVQHVLGPAGVPTPSKAWLCRLFKKWRWTLKVPDRVAQLAKYTDENMLYYITFYKNILGIDPAVVKYIDECHVNHMNFRRKRVRGPKGGKVRVAEHRSLRGTTVSVTVCTSLDALTEPLAVDIREGSNTQFDYTNFVAYLIEAGFLRAGDYLIADNWSGHAGADTLPFLSALCEAAGVQLRRTPTYSPEMNAAELVFSYLKWFLATHSSGHEIWLEVLIALSNISRDHVVGFYKHVRDLGVVGF